MNIEYSEDIINTFSSSSHVYSIGDENHLIGYAGDPTIGEYVHLYFQFNKPADSMGYADSTIIKANFSAIGGIVLLAACEKFCSLIENMTFQDALKYCDPEIIQRLLHVPSEKLHSINFVIQAFYKAFEVLTVL